jgi:hypothetical protein
MKAINKYKQTREEGALINRQVKEEEERQAIKEQKRKQMELEQQANFR